MGETAAPHESEVIGRDPLKLVCNTFSWLKDNLVLPDEAATHVESPCRPSKFSGHPLPAKPLPGDQVCFDASTNLADAALPLGQTDPCSVESARPT